MHEVVFLDLANVDSEDMQYVIWRNIFKAGCLHQSIEMITPDFFKSFSVYSLNHLMKEQQHQKSSCY